MTTYFVKNDFNLKLFDESNLDNSYTSEDDTKETNKNKSNTNSPKSQKSDKEEKVKTGLDDLNLKKEVDNESKDQKIRRSKTTVHKSNKKAFEKKQIFSTSNTNLYRNIFRLKSILLGNIAVGKTSLINRFLVNKFSNEYSSSIGVEFKVKSMPVNEHTTVDLQIWDTCGQEKFRTLTRQYYREANAVILVFDLTNKSTFNDIITWILDVKEHGPKDCLLVLVGNKIDLKSQREVSFSEAVQFAKSYSMDYFEVSAKTGYGIKFIFEIIARSLVYRIEENIQQEKGGNKYFDKLDKRRASSLVVIEGKKKKGEGCCK